MKKLIVILFILSVIFVGINEKEHILIPNDANRSRFKIND